MTSTMATMNNSSFALPATGSARVNEIQHRRHPSVAMIEHASLVNIPNVGPLIRAVLEDAVTGEEFAVEYRFPTDEEL